MSENEPQTRLRGAAMAVTTKTKQRLSKEFGESIENQNKDKFCKYLEKKFSLSSDNDIENSNYLEFDAPQFKGLCKEKNLKMRVTENAFLTKLGFEPDRVANEPTKIKFKRLLNCFEESKIDDFEIQDLLNFDFEVMSITKDKLSNIIDKLSIMVNSNTQSTEENRKKNELLAFLCNKLNEIRNSEKNTKTVINNIEKVNSLMFDKGKITVNFD